MAQPNTKDFIPVVKSVKVKYRDIFDMKEYYEALKEWMVEHEWKSFDDKTEEWETYYSEKIGSGGAREIWIWWRLAKKAPETEALRYHLYLTFHTLGLASTEVIKGGQKINTHKGEVELEIEAYIEEKYKKALIEGELDESGKRKKHLFNFVTKQIAFIFQKRIYTQTIEQRKKELYQEVYVLNNFIKQWFKMKRYLPYEETKSFFPSYAWPSHLKEE